jgi:hypothetical protein
MSDNMEAAHNLSTPYRPVALYYEESDSLEYVRRDVPCVYRRVDELLTTVLEMRSRETIGFRLKGFRHFYLQELKPLHSMLDGDFLAAVSVLERAMSVVGNNLFGEQKAAYKKAREIAREDGVVLRDLPPDDCAA